MLNSDEAASALGVSRDTIHRYVTEGKLPADRLGLRKIIRIAPDVLKEFAEQHGMACYLPKKQKER